MTAESTCWKTLKTPQTSDHLEETEPDWVKLDQTGLPEAQQSLVMVSRQTGSVGVDHLSNRIKVLFQLQGTLKTDRTRGSETTLDRNQNWTRTQNYSSLLTDQQTFVNICVFMTLHQFYGSVLVNCWLWFYWTSAGKS